MFSTRTECVIFKNKYLNNQKAKVELTRDKTSGEKYYCIRCWYNESLKQILNNSKFNINTSNIMLSSKYSTFEITYSNKKILLVHASKEKEQRVFFQKELSPASFGLKGQYTKNNLIQLVISKINSLNKSNIVKSSLIKLVQQANREEIEITKDELLSIINDESTISSDFGEILSAIYLANNNSIIEFPESISQPLYDFKLDNTLYSVKGNLSSGTSLTSIPNITEKLDIIKQTNINSDYKKIIQIFKILLNKKTPIINSLLLAGLIIDTPQSKWIKQKLKKEDISIDDLKQYVKKYHSFVSFLDNNKDFFFVDKNKPKGVGLSQDARDYFKGKRNENKNTTGENCFIQSPENLIIYPLAVSLKNALKNNEYCKIIINDLFKDINIKAVFVTLANGNLHINEYNISNLDIIFDYHARVEEPNRNRMGIKLMPPKK